jgi:hypothetical protein
MLKSPLTLKPPAAVIRPRSLYVWIWFALEAFIALFPPIYWLVGQPKPTILGLPSSIVYCVALCIVIAASLLAAYWDDERRGAFSEARL